VPAAHARPRAHPRLDRPTSRPTRAVPLEAVLERAEGLVCLTGCADHGIEDEPTARRLLDAFGPGALRIELQRTYAREDKARNRARQQLARRLGVPTIATGGVHAHTQMRTLLQDALIAVKHGMTLDESEVERRPNHTHVLARPDAMAARFADYPDAVAETVRLADTLRFKLTGDLGYRYPGADSTQAIRDLGEVCRVEFDARYPPGHRLLSEATGRLEEELRIIDTLGLAGFFLLHHELLELARQVAAEVRGGGSDSPRTLLPPGRGRGSSVSSIVCYLTGLSGPRRGPTYARGRGRSIPRPRAFAHPAAKSCLPPRPVAAPAIGADRAAAPGCARWRSETRRSCAVQNSATASRTCPLRRPGSQGRRSPRVDRQRRAGPRRLSDRAASPAPRPVWCVEEDVSTYRSRRQSPAAPEDRPKKPAPVQNIRDSF
jgi:hypothetical protein